jgi:hypothetical protein
MLLELLTPAYSQSAWPGLDRLSAHAVGNTEKGLDVGQLAGRALKQP